MFKKIKPNYILPIFIGIFFATAVSIAAYQVNNWHRPDDWVKAGKIISSKKIAENFKYLYNQISSSGSIKLGTYTELTHVGGGGGGWNKIRLCPPGNVVVGLNVNAGRYIDGFKVMCAPLLSGTSTIQMVSDTYSWSTGAWGRCTSTCGFPGTQTRNVLCVNSNGVVVSDSFCDATTKPTNIQRCVLPDAGCGR